MVLVEYSLNPAIYSLPTCKMALSTDQVAQLSSGVAAAVTQALSSHTEMSSEVDNRELHMRMRKILIIDVVYYNTWSLYKVRIVFINTAVGLYI